MVRKRSLLLLLVHVNYELLQRPCTFYERMCVDDKENKIPNFGVCIQQLSWTTFATFSLIYFTSFFSPPRFPETHVGDFLNALDVFRVGIQYGDKHRSSKSNKEIVQFRILWDMEQYSLLQIPQVSKIF